MFPLIAGLNVSQHSCVHKQFFQLQFPQESCQHTADIEFYNINQKLMESLDRGNVLLIIY